MSVLRISHIAGWLLAGLGWAVVLFVSILLYTDRKKTSDLADYAVETSREVFENSFVLENTHVLSGCNPAGFRSRSSLLPEMETALEP